MKLQISFSQSEVCQCKYKRTICAELYIQILRPSALTATHNMFVLALTQRSLQAVLQVLTSHSFESSVLSTSYSPFASFPSLLIVSFSLSPLPYLYLTLPFLNHPILPPQFQLLQFFYSFSRPSYQVHLICIPWAYTTVTYILQPFPPILSYSHLIPMLCTTSSGLIFHLLSHFCLWPPHLYMGWLALKPKNHSSFSTLPITHPYPHSLTWDKWTDPITLSTIWSMKCLSHQTKV